MIERGTGSIYDESSLESGFDPGIHQRRGRRSTTRLSLPLLSGAYSILNFCLPVLHTKRILSVTVFLWKSDAGRKNKVSLLSKLSFF
ncbi:hypothetical protein AVEN_146770-1 [Araneus ventricosus]|uniref:Uncharacterized protein n=1 Tax=Araneus ventricosus TaxID=182803 RepID=A0A4Y2D922_ARAVE|nr:hypothetical protein AVEN_146770-1 [Araneus ventricosus]